MNIKLVYNMRQSNKCNLLIYTTTMELAELWQYLFHALPCPTLEIEENVRIWAANILVLYQLPFDCFSVYYMYIGDKVTGHLRLIEQRPNIAPNLRTSTTFIYHPNVVQDIRKSVICDTFAIEPVACYMSDRFCMFKASKRVTDYVAEHFQWDKLRLPRIVAKKFNKMSHQDYMSKEAYMSKDRDMDKLLPLIKYNYTQIIHCILHNEFCSYCFAASPCKTCSGCNNVRYCSEACQRAEWNNHKDICKYFAINVEIAKERNEIVIIKPNQNDPEVRQRIRPIYEAIIAFAAADKEEKLTS